MRIGINGFGRIGRQFFRIAWGDPQIDIVHVNDLGDARSLAHLLKHDSTYGVWGRHIGADEDSIEVDDRTIPVSAERAAESIPWRKREVDVVVDCTGAYRSREAAAAHLRAGAGKVLISAPAKVDATVVLGVNENRYDRDRHDVISIGSCTTNALAPVCRVLHEELGIERGLMTTVHAYTTSQQLLDSAPRHKDVRRARSAPENIIPTSTGAAATLAQVMPELAGRLDALSMRVPVAVGSIVDLTCLVARRTSAEEVNDAFRRWSEGSLRGILRVSEEPIVSSDIVGDPCSAIIAPEDTRVMDGDMLKVLAWYDNEWAFSTRLLDVLKLM
jgi:glyceraldehyde 3-phosphate dehydrogenase